MLAPSRGRLAHAAAAASVPNAAVTATIPSFLAPALFQQQKPAGRQQFSQTASQSSKLGRTPISIPPGVELIIGEPVVKKDPTTYLQIPKRTVTVKGPLGELGVPIPPYLKIDHDVEARKAVLSIEDKSIKQQMEMWGTTWAFLTRDIIGVSEGHTAILRLVGVGYRATIEERPRKAAFPGQKFVCLKLGFTHPVEEPVPMGMKASTPQPTRILLEGINKEQVMSLAARIRHWRRPEPYKGKGIFVNDETIKLKQKKIK
ncbi:ribosomal protein L6, alpha-beta domain-containing protein [Microdochium trichocladiopsis]|uniref:Ribosomal protein L6, alpha-beta domain-containing protein n=1 Tax=Microdochium trichocladiopsis TaxID=1682393 RepID=A0A9P9BT58_9PEZI|nr:ribosomal protein L6, alpha-beta domain-containing protein [Microdochium trichocladiopsis]KAH7029501.1 ribosomal protein L6, alpha-beta domain-containing protein [Microdochium trichocladiopsis]